MKPHIGRLDGGDFNKRAVRGRRASGEKVATWSKWHFPPSTQLILMSHEKKLCMAPGHWKGRLLMVAGDRANDGLRLTCDPQRNECPVK